MPSAYQQRKQKITDMKKILETIKSENGAEQFDEIDYLEILMKYIFNKRDSYKQISADILEKFGSLNGLFFAPIEELSEIENLGYASAEYLSCFCDILSDEFGEKPILKTFLSFKAAIEFCKKKFESYTKEAMLVFYLNNQFQLLLTEEYTDENYNSVTVDKDHIIERALEVKASKIILSHNHPNGITLPSSMDIAITRRLILDLREVDISLCDHIIIGGGSYYSLRESGRLEEFL